VFHFSDGSQLIILTVKSAQKKYRVAILSFSILQLVIM